MWYMVAPLISKALDKFFPGDTEETKAKRIELELELQKALIESDTKQVEANANEASHQSIFVAGWRPMVGWVCAISFAAQFLIWPLVNWGLAMHGMDPLPELHADQLDVVLMGMLGLGGLRSFDKLRGIDTKRPK